MAIIEGGEYQEIEVRESGGKSKLEKIKDIGDDEILQLEFKFPFRIDDIEQKINKARELLIERLGMTISYYKYNQANNTLIVQIEKIYFAPGDRPPLVTTGLITTSVISQIIKFLTLALIPATIITIHLTNFSIGKVVTGLSPEPKENGGGSSELSRFYQQLFSGRFLGLLALVVLLVWGGKNEKS